MNEQSIFLNALDLQSTAERARYLDVACGQDIALRERIDRLLLAHEALGGILDHPAVSDDGTSAYRSMCEGPGAIIGSYKLLQEIGEGGFGVVFMAEQEYPVRREVALKIIKPGMDTHEVIARFESERQALALMDHPNIAKVLAAGATQSGRPYFVMELVKGVPITEFCDTNRLPLETRLKLFSEVCQAIQHAHHKGVIHRDIKPSNVLVALQDGKPVIRVIDFGVAKAISQKLTQKTLFTAHGQMIGTPAYMSPEQAEMNGLDIDTRSDIYSLGVLLYELLTRTTPLDSKRLAEVGLAETQRLIREEEAQRPSARISSLDDAATSVASNCGLNVKQLVHTLAGDLDSLVMKALDKDRDRRYGTPDSFVEDIERYLRGETVLARPPSMVYKLKKFAKRNRTVVLTTGLVAIALLVVTAVAVWQSIRATAAREEALKEVAATARERDEKQAALCSANDALAAREDVIVFLESNVLAAARPEGQEGGLGHDVSLRKALEVALPLLGASFEDQPLTEARLRMTLGASFQYLGEEKIAAAQFERAHAVYAQLLGLDDPDSMASMINLANSYAALGQDSDALKLREKALTLTRAKLGPDHENTLAAMANLACSYDFLGHHIDALKLREETLALQTIRFGSDHLYTLLSMHNLAFSYDSLGRNVDALKLREQTLALMKTSLGPRHPDTLKSMHSLAKSYEVFGRHSDGLKLREESFAAQKAKLGGDHPETLSSMNCLAESYFALGRRAEAVRLQEESLVLMKGKFGSDCPTTLLGMYKLAAYYDGLGRHEDARKLREETLALRRTKLGPDHADTLLSMQALALSYIALRKDADAVRLSEEALALMKAKLGPENRATLASMTSLAFCYYIAGRPAEAIALQDEALKAMQSKLGRGDPYTALAMCNLSWWLATASEIKLRDPLRAIELAVKAAELSPSTPECWLALGTAHYRVGKWKDAVVELEKAIALRKLNDISDGAVFFSEAAGNGYFLAMAHWQQGEKSKARECYAKAMEWMGKGRKDHADSKRFRAEAQTLLGVEK